MKALQPHSIAQPFRAFPSRTESLLLPFRAFTSSTESLDVPDDKTVVGFASLSLPLSAAASPDVAILVRSLLTKMERKASYKRQFTLQSFRRKPSIHLSCFVLEHAC